jgi:hypothetical protein
MSAHYLQMALELVQLRTQLPQDLGAQLAAAQRSQWHQQPEPAHFKVQKQQTQITARQRQLAQ